MRDTALRDLSLRVPPMKSPWPLILLTFIVTWRIEWMSRITCAPVTDPWTGETTPAPAEPLCFEPRFKWMSRAFDTLTEVEAFLATKPEGVTNVRVEHFVEQPKKSRRRGEG